MPDYELQMRLIFEKFDCSPEDVTAILKIEPKRTLYKGQIIRGDIIAKKNIWWVFSIDSMVGSKTLGCKSWHSQDSSEKDR